jgi:hypothetical protein
MERLERDLRRKGGLHEGLIERQHQARPSTLQQARGRPRQRRRTTGSPRATRR